MRMVRLPRCHGKLGAKLGRSDCFARRAGQSAGRERLKRGQQQARRFAPKAELVCEGVGEPFETFLISNCRLLI